MVTSKISRPNVFRGLDSRTGLADWTHTLSWKQLHLSVDDGLIVYGCRLLIPASMRRQVLISLHESHQGSVRTKERARLSIYWPGIDNDIDNVVLSCKMCQDRLPSNNKEYIMSNQTRKTVPGDCNGLL